MNPSIGFIRIKIILAMQYWHYYKCFEFQWHHQIAFSMIVPNWEGSINHNLIALHLSLKIDIPNLFSSYFAFSCSMHSPTICALCILCVAQTMANCKISPTCFPRTSASLIIALKGNFLVCILNCSNFWKVVLNCHNLWWVNKETSDHGFCKLCVFTIIPWSRIHDFFNGKC